MQQPLRTTAQATADANGNATFTFPAVPQGQWWTGTVQVQLAPNYSLFVATVAEVGWGTWQGSQPFGPVQAEGRLSVKVVATSLIPLTHYVAVLQGIASTTPADTPSATPSVNTPPTTQVTNLLTTAVTFANAGSQPQVIVAGIAPAHAGLLITWSQPISGLQNMNVIVQGVDSNLVIGESYIRGNSTEVFPLRGIDSSVVIQMQPEQNAGATFPYSGTLAVAVQQLSPIVIPQTRLAYIGQGRIATATVGSGAAAQQCLAAPLDNTYYRIKRVELLMSAAPAAGAIMQFYRNSDSRRIAGWRTDGTASQHMAAEIDWEFGFDIILAQNASTQSATASILYEEWPDQPT